MVEYDNEKWVALYRSALIELQHSLMAGRIMDARTEIAARIEQLTHLPGLHAVEREALQDALSGLRSLEEEEIRYAADQQRKLATVALEKLRVLEPVMSRFETGQQE